MKYFLFNHAGSLNHGCEAIVRGTMNIIKNADSDCSFVLSSFNPGSDSGIDGVELKSMETRALSGAEKIIAALDLRIRGSEVYALEKMYSEVAAQADDCDICLSIGGDTYCYGDNHGIQVLTDELKKRGKKVVLWGASIGEEDLTEQKEKSLNSFDAIFARDPITYSMLKDKNIDTKLVLKSDPAFCMERETVTLPDGFEKMNTLGFNISPLIERSNSRILGISEKFLKYIIDNTTLNIILIPHVVEQGNNDWEYMRNLYDSLKSSGRIAILPDDLNAKQYKGYISQTRFFIGARTHATIAAYSNGVPTIALGYSVKSRGISEDIFGDEKYVIDVNNMEDETCLIDSFNDLLKDEIEIKNKLKKSIPMRIKSAMELGDELLKL